MLNITDRLITKNRPFRKLKKLKAIIIHWTANTRIGANAAANARYFNSDQYFTKINGQKIKISASAHYVVDDKEIIRCIPDDEVGYHVGSKSGYKELVYNTINIPREHSPNDYTIGIEMCVNSDGDFAKTRQNTIELTNFLLKQHNLTIANVFRHFDITGKDCPKMMLEQDVWQQFLLEIENYSENDVRFKVNTAELNVRTGNGTNFSVKRKLGQGDIVVKKGQQGIWLKIGEDEWINSNYVIPL